LHLLLQTLKAPKEPPYCLYRFIDPLTDFGFKWVFGSELNKDSLIAFLNELFNSQLKKEEHRLEASICCPNKTALNGGFLNNVVFLPLIFPAILQLA
jgi:hypothetical protein